MDRLPGFRDFYPEPLPSKDASSFDLRSYIFGKWRETARKYGFREYDGPPLEPLELFTLKSGDEIVGQLYNFEDKGGRAVALRPELTPTLARMAAAAERNYPKPVKWFSIPQLFRYERQQKGRLREHFQLNADIIGEADVAADAELIALLIDTLRSLGLTEEHFVIRLSSRNAWNDFFSKRCQDASKAYEFFQIIDKIEREDPAVTETKLQALGFTSAEVHEFIQSANPTDELRKVLDNLAARNLGGFVKIDYNIIRGLAYYTGIVFEAFDRKGDLRAIAGGGRYNNLVKLISGGKVDLPALGFGMGDVVLGILLTQQGLLPSLKARIDAFVLIEDESLRHASLGLVQKLRDGGIIVEYPITPQKSDKQFKRALELGAGHTLRLAARDGNTICIVKNLGDRSQDEMSVEDAIARLLS